MICLPLAKAMPTGKLLKFLSKGMHSAWSCPSFTHVGRLITLYPVPDPFKASRPMPHLAPGLAAEPLTCLKVTAEVTSPAWAPGAGFRLGP